MREVRKAYLNLQTLFSSVLQWSLSAPKSKIYPAWFVQPCALRSIVDSQFHWQSDIHQQVSTGKARLLGDPEIPNGSSPNPNDADFVTCSERLAGKTAIYERSITWHEVNWITFLPQGFSVNRVLSPLPLHDPRCSLLIRLETTASRIRFINFSTIDILGQKCICFKRWLWDVWPLTTSNSPYYYNQNVPGYCQMSLQ